MRRFRLPVKHLFGCLLTTLLTHGALAAEETCTLRVVATVPADAGTVYLSGNIPALGGWNPTALAMEGTGSERSAVVQVPCGSTVEFKLNAGSWSKQAVDDLCRLPGNTTLTVSEDTTERVTVIKFRNTGTECPWPDATRWEDTIANFEKEDAANPPPAGAFLAVGSSSIVGWHGTIARDLAPRTTIARGFGGSTMNDLLEYTDRIVIPYKPSEILLYEGDNDIEMGVFPETVVEAYKTFFSRVHEALPETVIYVLPVKPSPARWGVWPEMQEVNAALRTIAENDPLIHFVDTITPMLGKDGKPREELFLGDMLHMNPSGYEVWTKAVREVIGEAPKP